MEVSKLPDIGLTCIVGEQPEEVQVESDPERLSLHSTEPQQLVAKIEGVNKSFRIVAAQTRCFAPISLRVSICPSTERTSPRPWVSSS